MSHGAHGGQMTTLGVGSLSILDLGIKLRSWSSGSHRFTGCAILPDQGRIFLNVRNVTEYVYIVIFLEI